MYACLKLSDNNPKIVIKSFFSVDKQRFPVIEITYQHGKKLACIIAVVMNKDRCGLPITHKKPCIIKILASV